MGSNCGVASSVWREWRQVEGCAGETEGREVVWESGRKKAGGGVVAVRGSWAEMKKKRKRKRREWAGLGLQVKKGKKKKEKEEKGMDLGLKKKKGKKERKERRNGLLRVDFVCKMGLVLEL